MTQVAFGDLMADAEQGGYAVGYFESWNLESLQAVADAAEALRSPVILGFSGIYLPHPARIVRDGLDPYAAMGQAICRQLSVPACLLFNESPHLDWVFRALRAGFGLVMFTDDRLSPGAQQAQVADLVVQAHAAVAVAVEAEVAALPGVGGELTEAPDDLHLTDPAAAADFVAATGVDALAVNVGQAHLHGRREVRLNLAHLAALRAALPLPLVLHGATSVERTDLAQAVGLGIRKVNVGSVLKRAYFEAVRRACTQTGVEFNPYEVVGSGLAGDVLAAGRVAMRQVVEDYMRLLGSAGKAG